MTGLLDELCGFARGYGVTVSDPTVLGATSNVVVHLAPAPVVARVPLVTALGRDRPEIGLQREIEMSTHLARAGLPVIAPSGLLPAGPHRLGRQWVSFFAYEPLRPVADTDAEAVGQALADLLDATADMEDPNHIWDRSLPDEAHVVLDRMRPFVADDDHETLATWLEEASVTAPGDRQPVHADPHRLNVGRRADGRIVWFDFDDAVADDVRVDLATLHRSWPAAGAVACGRFDVDPTAPELLAFVEQREMWGALWSQFYAHHFGGEYAVGAAEAIAGRRQ